MKEGMSPSPVTEPPYRTGRGGTSPFKATVGLGLASILVGLAAATADPVVVAFALVMLVGLPLLWKPNWLVSIIIAAGLLIVGIVPIWNEGPGSKAVWGVSSVGIALLAVALFAALTRRGITRGTPPFVWACLAFLLYATLNGLAQFDSAFEFFGGFKRYFQVYGLVFALAWLPFDEDTIRKWRQLLLLVALVQLPFALYERVVLTPIREGYRYAYPGMVPIDVVAGTLGASRTGGGASGEMSLFLIIAGIFLLARFSERLLPLWRFVTALSLVLAPIFLAEVKAVLVMLPLAIVVYFRGEILRRPHYALVGSALGAALTVAVALATLDSMGAKSTDRFIDNALNYNVGSLGYGGFALNRTTVLTFWAREQGLHDPVSLVLGNGIGSSHSVSGGHLTTHRYLGMGIGLTGASTLLWDEGVLGTGLFFLILLLVWNAAGRLRKRSAEAWVRADAFAIQTSMPLFGFFSFYLIGVLENMSIQIVFGTILGYLAWLWRRQSRIETAGAP
jgi:hypothetical protein